MSVESRTIVIFGKNIGVKEFRRVEELDEALSESNLFVLDGMCGSYCYFGLPLAYIYLNKTMRYLRWVTML